MKTTTLILSLMTISTFASLGRKAEPESFPTGICRLTFEKIEYSDTYHCTGSLVSSRLIKTAGHCLEKAKLIKVDCGEFESLEFFPEMRFPKYQHRTLMREEENRWQDHALIQLKKSAPLPPLKMIKTLEEFEQQRKNFSQCLIAGFGIHEETQLGTGNLVGTIYSPNKVELRDGLVVAKGSYLFELLPGDSGGPLLCYGSGRWFDLGTASAHNWDHESLYAANFLNDSVIDWFSQFDLESSIEIFQGPARNKKVERAQVEIGKRVKLKPYTIIKTENGDFYNGDANASIEIEFVLRNKVFGKITSNDMSKFYTCDPHFLCYGDQITGTVEILDLKP